MRCVSVRSDRIVQLKRALEDAVKIHDYLIVSEQAHAICQEACTTISGGKVSTGFHPPSVAHGLPERIRLIGQWCSHHLIYSFHMLVLAASNFSPKGCFCWPDELLISRSLNSAVASSLLFHTLLLSFQVVTTVGTQQPADGEAAAPSNFPSEDDGLTCMLQNLPGGWGAPRVQAYVERFNLKPQQVSRPLCYVPQQQRVGVLVDSSAWGQ